MPAGGASLTFFVSMRFNLLYLVAQLLTAGLALPGAAWAQVAAPPTFYTRDRYTAYTVFDASEDGPPTRVSGVGGTLTLRADGTYEKRMSILAPSGPYYFNQTGRFVLTGDSIRFSFTDAKGSDTQRGTFRFDSARRRLTLTIFGYPSGNKGVYELAAAKAAGKPVPAKPTLPPSSRRAKAGAKARPETQPRPHLAAPAPSG